MFDPREWEYTPEPEAFSTIVAKDSPKEIESVDPFDLDVSQPTPTRDPDPEEAFSTITHEPDPGRDFNLVEAITAPDEGGEYDYHQTPTGLIVAQEPEQPRDDTGRFIPSEPTENDNAPAVFSTIVAEDPGAPDEGGEYDYFQTPAGLTVAKLQPGDHLLEEAEVGPRDGHRVVRNGVDRGTGRRRRGTARLGQGRLRHGQHQGDQ